MPLDTGVPHPWDIHTLHSLRRQMVSGSLNDGTKNSHHRLPGSRGGKYPKKKEKLQRERNLIDVNKACHDHWHTLVYNKTAREVAVQFNMWWLRGHIFRNEKDRLKFECHSIAPGTKGSRKLLLWNNVPADTMDMSKQQLDAWRNLFGPNTPPEIVRMIINEFLVHPDTPLILVPHLRS